MLLFCNMNPLEQLKQILSGNGYSMTKPRMDVFQDLAEKDQPITIAAVVYNLPDIDRASIYRTIGLFEELGVIHRVWNGFKSKIELSETFSPHHHHFSCNNCGVILALDSERLESSLHDLEAMNGFSLTQHSVELRGICKSCSAKNVQTGA